MVLEPKTVLFCDSETDEQAVTAAKEYIKDHDLTAEQVRIVKRQGVTCVETKVKIEWPLKKPT